MTSATWFIPGKEELLTKRLCVLAVLAALSISLAAVQDDATSDTSGNLAEMPQFAPISGITSVPVTYDMECNCL